jgi:hypothetical protein
MSYPMPDSYSGDMKIRNNHDYFLSDFRSAERRLKETEIVMKNLYGYKDSFLV